MPLSGTAAFAIGPEIAVMACQTVPSGPEIAVVADVEATFRPEIAVMADSQQMQSATTVNSGPKTARGAAAICHNRIFWSNMAQES